MPQGRANISTRCSRRFLRSTAMRQRRRGLERLSPASDRIFDIDSFSAIFVPFFSAPTVRALEGGNCGGKLLFARRGAARHDGGDGNGSDRAVADSCYYQAAASSSSSTFSEDERMKSGRVENRLSRDLPRAQKMMFAPIRELRAISRYE